MVDYTAQALQRKHIRIIGVCFGHQIVARAMGVKVGRNPEGWEAAVNNVQLSKQGQDFFGLQDLVRLSCAVLMLSFRCLLSNAENTPDASRYGV